MNKIKSPKTISSLWKLGLTLPWSNAANSTTLGNQYVPTNSKFPTSTFVIADAVNLLSQVALYAGGTLMFFWAVWGVFDYIKGEGNKEALAKARKKIQWAIVGFVILIFAFFASEFLQNVLIGGPVSRTIKPLSK